MSIDGRGTSWVVQRRVAGRQGEDGAQVAPTDKIELVRRTQNFAVDQSLSRQKTIERVTTQSRCARMGFWARSSVVKGGGLVVDRERNGQGPAQFPVSDPSFGRQRVLGW